MIMNFNGTTGSGGTWRTGDVEGADNVDISDLTTATVNSTEVIDTAVAVPEPL